MQLGRIVHPHRVFINSQHPTQQTQLLHPLRRHPRLLARPSSLWQRQQLRLRALQFGPQLPLDQRLVHHLPQTLILSRRPSHLPENAQQESVHDHEPHRQRLSHRPRSRISLPISGDTQEDRA